MTTMFIKSSIIRGPIRSKFFFQVIRPFSLSALSSLPEFKAASQFDRQGNFTQAIPLYKRTHDVLSSSMGPSSPLSVYVALQLVKSFIHAGQFNQAEAVLSVEPFIHHDTATIPFDSSSHSNHSSTINNNMQIDSNNSEHSSYAIKAQQLKSTICFLQGDMQRAAQAAEQSANLCEAQDSKENDISLYASSYGLKGLSNLYLGDISESEQYLQMAARWSQSPEESVVTLNNLGTLSWVKLSLALGLKEDKNVIAHFSTRDLLYFATKESLDKGVLLNDNDYSLLQEAISYWEDAVYEATSDRHGSNTNAQQTAAALCGANMAFGDISMPTPLTVPKNPIGMDVRTIPGTKKEVGKAVQGEDVLTIRLKDVNFTINYANLLCNLATGRTFLAAHQHSLKSATTKTDSTASEKIEGKTGETTTVVTKETPKQYEEQQSEQIKSSVDLLTAAVKALEIHLTSNVCNTNSNNSDGSSSNSSENEVTSKVTSTELIIAPVLGRALGYLGALYLHPFRGAMPEPVFAEGLFRASLDKLNGPYAVKDKRYLYERAVATRDYGNLLEKWDKREDTGLDMKRDADIIFDILPKFQSSFTINSMISLPVNL